MNRAYNMGRLSMTVLACLCLCLTTNAQTKKRTPVTGARKTQTAAQRSSSATAAKPKVCHFAAYSGQKAKSAFVDDSLLFYVESGNNNAVMAISCTTGKKITVIDGIEGVYEGVRPRIGSVVICGGHLFYELEKEDGIYIFDGATKRTEKIPNSMYLAAANERYMLFRALGHDCRAYDLWDMQTLKGMKWYKSDQINDGKVHIARDASFWFFEMKSIMAENNQTINPFGVTRQTQDGTQTFFSLSDQKYIAENGLRSGGNETFKQVGDYLYYAIGRRVYRINMMDAQPRWEEFAKMPPTQDSQFQWICPTPQGAMLTASPTGSTGMKRTIQYWKPGAYDSPTDIAVDEIPTGFSEYAFRNIMPSLCRGNGDNFGNFVLTEKNGGDIYIYNPIDIQGYKTSRGTIVKQVKK